MEEIGEEISQFFLVIMGMCVYFMQCGFAFLEAGAVRSKNVTNILIKNLFDSFVAGLSFWLIGYAFAFGEGNQFIGHSHFFSIDLPDTQYAHYFFQYTFAATATTIVSGAVAERCEFVAYFIYSFFITGVIYPVVTHWVWGGGFLVTGVDYGGDIGNVGYQDFAGSGVVHVVGGVAAFAGAAMLGPRVGRFHRETNRCLPLRGHSVPLAALGGFILLFGFLAFNGGSQITIHNKGDGAAVGIAVTNTVLSASTAGAVSLVINRISLFGNSAWSLCIMVNGALTGMVAACAGCNVLYPWGAVVLGCFAGISLHFWSWVMRKIRIDDPLDAIAVHFGGGIWGVIAVGFFDRSDGLVFTWNIHGALGLAWQVAGLAVIISWTAVLSFLLFGLMRLLKILRVPLDLEVKGLDIPKHNEPAYPVEAYGHGHTEKMFQTLENGPSQNTRTEVPAVPPRHSVESVGYSNLSFTRESGYEHPEVGAYQRNTALFARDYSRQLDNTAM